MVKRMNFSSLFKNREAQKPSWAWPSCKYPKTESFRAGEEIFKTVNSVYFDGFQMGLTPESWSTTSPESGSSSTVSDESGGETLETVIRGLRSDRLFFEPGDTNSILEEAKSGDFRFKQSVVLAIESEDPYSDFRNSMEEMVEAHGLKNWDCLEELLQWYLRVNVKKTHALIVSAFIDLLVGIASSNIDRRGEGAESLSSLKNLT